MIQRSSESHGSLVHQGLHGYRTNLTYLDPLFDSSIWPKGSFHIWVPFTT
jgi:hypothetical protein